MNKFKENDREWLNLRARKRLWRKDWQSDKRSAKAPDLAGWILGHDFDSKTWHFWYEICWCFTTELRQLTLTSCFDQKQTKGASQASPNQSSLNISLRSFSPKVPCFYLLQIGPTMKIAPKVHSNASSYFLPQRPNLMQSSFLNHIDIIVQFHANSSSNDGENYKFELKWCKTEKK